MLQIQKKISSYNFNLGNTVKYIVIHDVGAYGTAKNNVDYFYGGNRGASAHYFVDDNSIWQSVEDTNGAWSVGDGKGKYGITNMNSISIEMCLPSHDVTELTENNTIELVKYLMNKYDVPIERVVRHYDASRKNCPATFSDNNWARWNRFKAKLDGQVSTSQSNKPVENPQVNNSSKIKTVAEGKAFVGNKCKDLQQKLIKVGYDCGGFGADGIYGKRTHEDLIAFQKKHGLTVDGLAGNNTFKKLDEVIKCMNTPTPKPPTASNSGYKLVPQKGKCTWNTSVQIREKPSTKAKSVGQYSKGQTVIYDYYVDNEGYRWISWIGGSGKRRYSAVRVLSNNKKYGNCV